MRLKIIFSLRCNVDFTEGVGCIEASFTNIEMKNHLLEWESKLLSVLAVSLTCEKHLILSRFAKAR